MPAAAAVATDPGLRAIAHLSGRMDAHDELFIYRDAAWGGNADFIPAGRMGDAAHLSLDEAADDPDAGETCLRLDYTGTQGAGLYWQRPAANWGQPPPARGRDLSGATTLRFRARAQPDGLTVEIGLGGIGGDYGDSCPKRSRQLALTADWQTYEVSLDGLDLSHVVGGFLVVFTLPGTVWLDEIRLDLVRPAARPHLLPSYVVTTDSPLNPQQRNAAHLHDNALAMLAYAALARDESADPATRDNARRRLGILADTLVWLQPHDRTFADGRLRNVYWGGGDLADADGHARLAAWYDAAQPAWREDAYAAESHAGNLAWAALALTEAAVTLAPGPTADAARQAAGQLLDWIESRLRADDALGGYYGGLAGADASQARLEWRSTEHNLDVAAAAARLHALTAEPRFQAMAAHARQFVNQTFDERRGHYWTGTAADGSLNRDVIPLDVQAWAALADPGSLAARRAAWWAHGQLRGRDDWAAPGTAGYAYSDAEAGVWCEGTAQMGLALLALDDEARATPCREALRNIQEASPTAPPQALVATCRESLDTGFGSRYYRVPHVGATAWLALLESRFNPLRGEPIAPAAAPPAGRQVGFSFGKYHDASLYEFHPQVIESTLDRLRAMSVDYTEICPVWFTPDRQSSEIHDLGEAWAPGSHGITMSDDTLIALIGWCRAKGLEPTLRPMVELYDWAGWRGELMPDNVSAWFDNYAAMLLHYAEVAANHDLGLFCVGTEYVQLGAHTQEWRDLIAAVRLVYPGPLTYGANWDQVGDVAFFDALDYIGVSAYAPAADDTSPGAAEIQDRVRNYLATAVLPVCERLHKPAILLEFGLQNVDGAAMQPWLDFTTDGVPDTRDDQEQADYYTGFLAAAAEFPSVRQVSGWEANLIQPASLAALSFNPSGLAQAAVGVAAAAFRASDPLEPYAVVTVAGGTQTEYRLYCGRHHFGSLLAGGGVLAFRPHPGVDLNGWGTSCYLQPFLPGAVLGHTTVEAVAAEAVAIAVRASGGVSRGAAQTFGAWQLELRLSYDPADKRIVGDGLYAIQMPGPLSAQTGDLNLARLASNYLDDVPLLDGTTGDTGDMTQVEVHGAGPTVTWHPPEVPAFYHWVPTDALSIRMSGAYNQVDTAAQGYAAIHPAWKPALRLDLTSRNAATPMIFGGQYDTGQARNFWADNIGVTPLVITQSTETTFVFDLHLESAALAGDALRLHAPRGWWFFSLPVESGLTVAAFLAGAGREFADSASLWRWDAARQAYERCPASTVLSARTGYALYCPAAFTSAAAGGAYASGPLTLAAGWHLLGASGNPAAPPNPANARAVWRYDTAAATQRPWPLAVPLSLGQAFWLFLDAPAAADL